MNNKELEQQLKDLARRVSDIEDWHKPEIEGFKKLAEGYTKLQRERLERIRAERGVG